MSTTYPPGPHLPRAIQTALYARWRGRLLQTAARRYGEVFTLHLVAPYAENLVVFSRPEHIREIFAGDPADLHAGEGNRLLVHIMGEHSLLLTDEGEHARARRLLMPAFVGSSLRGYRALVDGIAKAHVDRWVSGSTVHTLDRMNELTLDVIMQVVFGMTDERRRDRLAPRLRRIVNINPIMFFGWKYPRLERRGPWKRFRENQNAIDELLYAEIVERRAHPDPDARADVLSRLLAVGSGENPSDAPLSDAELRDQLVTLLLAGHETTASALSWACHELAANPDIQDQARRAARDGDEKYLEAVLKEAMRLHTVIAATGRKLTRDMTIGGYALPKGTIVSTSILLAHQRPEAFPDTLTFRPGRFLDGSVAANTWLPFGGGVRRCIGAGFSLMEGTAVLREILTRYRLSLPAGTTTEPARIRNITHIPAHGARVVVTADTTVPDGKS
ncbi:cytochrome P450 [Nocardia seriolae]|uniref:cytochrome P450 n=1 Tax=Nocardia seriolae TaxID=37332 RepID=UPI00051A505C|nr:cytochrome P450 [Nocardia seriolae]OJF84376.1 cytochrome P450 [Nocardia seriolae]WKY55865.1 cytochrome P450 [Nocardia seriolae]WNJ55859.1 cytochrome P450 [Nocardia seriolae]